MKLPGTLVLGLAGGSVLLNYFTFTAAESPGNLAVFTVIVTAAAVVGCLVYVAQRLPRG